MLSWRYSDGSLEIITAASREKYPLTKQPSWQAVYYPHVIAYLSILVDGFRVQSRCDHGWPPVVCGMFSSSSEIEGCRAVVSGVIWIRLLESARLM